MLLLSLSLLLSMLTGMHDFLILYFNIRPLDFLLLSAKSRIDHAARYFDIPDEIINIDTHHPHVPPVFIVQAQFPSEPPPSMFTSVEDGPGWLGMFFFKITEVYSFVIWNSKMLDFYIYNRWGMDVGYNCSIKGLSKCLACGKAVR